jgi:hypothetical protein
MSVFADCSDSKVNRLMFNVPLRQLEFPKGFTLRMRGYDSIEAELVADPMPPWSGEGLPPVGTVCERMWPSGFIEYAKVRIIAHDDGQAVFRFMEGLRAGRVQADGQGDGDSLGNPIFRPIKTPEQIAAEDRDKAINQMEFDTDCLDRGAFTKLYDAGWRKFEIVDGEA